MLRVEANIVKFGRGGVFGGGVSVHGTSLGELGCNSHGDVLY